MLVITHQEGEILQIGPDIRILIRRVKGGWVRLCIDAPREIPIQRIVPADKESRPATAAPQQPPPEVTPQEVVVRRRRPMRAQRGE